MHSELSEALEGVRKNKQDDHLPHRKSVEVEFGKAIEKNTDQIEQAKIKNDELTKSIEERIAVISR